MRIAGLVVAAAAALASWGAESLPDPTRPPDLQGEMFEPVQAPALQSILIAPHRRQAIISGQVVKVGDKVRDAQVVEIREDRVVLRNGASTETLFLQGPREVEGIVREKQQPVMRDRGGRQQ
jgi:MSHA biogenesis protein MshK